MRRSRREREVASLLASPFSDLAPRGFIERLLRSTPRPCRTSPGGGGAARVARTARRAAGRCGRESAASIAANSGWLTLGHTSTAPSASVICMLRKRDAGLAPTSTPRPSHALHQPSGLLNEKWCGESGSKLRPHCAAHEVLAVDLHRPAVFGLLVVARWPGAARRGRGRGPFRCCRPARARPSLRIVMRSTITSTSCLRRRSTVGHRVELVRLRRRRARGLVAVALELRPQVLRTARPGRARAGP